MVNPPSSKPNAKRPMGRPTQSRAGEIEEHILSAAKDLFLSVGYEATSMEALAQKAGVSKRTLYARYASKEVVMRAVVQARVRSWSDEAATKTQDLPSDSRERLTRLAVTLAQSLGNPEIEQFDRLIFTTAHRFPEIARTFYDVGYSFELDYLTEEIASSTKNEGQPARDPRRVAEQLISMIMGWRRMEATVRSISSEEEAKFAQDAVALMFSGRVSW